VSDQQPTRVIDLWFYSILRHDVGDIESADVSISGHRVSIVSARGEDFIARGLGRWPASPGMGPGPGSSPIGSAHRDDHLLAVPYGGGGHPLVTCRTRGIRL